MGSMVDSKGGGPRVAAVSRAQRITDRFALRIGEPGYAPWLHTPANGSRSAPQSRQAKAAARSACRRCAPGIPHAQQQAIAAESADRAGITAIFGFLCTPRRVTGSWGCAVHKCRLTLWRKLIVMNRRSTSCEQTCAASAPWFGEPRSVQKFERSDRTMRKPAAR
jgi:hypothetical protein